MKIIGLTGGIGSGKSSVGEIFKSLGAPVFVADLEAKKLYKDSEILTRVKEALNEDDLLLNNGNLDTKKIASIVFNNPEKRTALNAVIHPEVKKQFTEWVGNHNFIYCIREAAILIEAGAHKDCDKIIVVACDKEKRISRVMKRDGVERNKVESRINSQMTDEERLQYADFVIDNNGTEEELLEQVVRIHQQLLL